MDSAEALIAKCLGKEDLSDIAIGKSDVKLISSLFKKFDSNFDANHDLVIQNLLHTYNKRRYSGTGLSPALKRIRLSQLSQIPCSQEAIPCSQEPVPCSQGGLMDDWPLSLSSQRDKRADDVPEENLFKIPDSLLSVPSLEISESPDSDDPLGEMQVETPLKEVTNVQKVIPKPLEPEKRAANKPQAQPKAKKKPLLLKKKPDLPKSNIRVKKERMPKAKSKNVNEKLTFVACIADPDIVPLSQEIQQLTFTKKVKDEPAL